MELPLQIDAMRSRVMRDLGLEVIAKFSTLAIGL